MLLVSVAFFSPPSARAQNYYWKDNQGNGRWDWGGAQWYSSSSGGNVGKPASDGSAIIWFENVGSTTTYINAGFTSGWFKLNSLYAAANSTGRAYVINVENGGTGIELYNKIETISGGGSLTFNCSVQTASGYTTEINAVGNSLTLSNLSILGALSSYGGNSLNITGVISGTNTYTIRNQGITVTYSGSGANTFTGATTVESSSTLVLNKSAGTKAIDGSLTINSGATLRTDAAGQLNDELVTVDGTFNMNNNSQSFALAGAGTVSMGSATLTNINTGSDTFSGKLTGTGALIKTNSGTFILSGAANDYSGATTVAGGTLAVSGNSALGATNAGTTVATNTTLDFRNVTYSTAEAVTNNGGTIAASTGTSSFAGAITLGGGSTFSVDGTQLTLSGAIGDGAGTFGITKTGTGRLILSSSNAYDGTTTISAGVLRMANANAIGNVTSNAVTVASGAALELSNSITVTNKALILNSVGISDGGGLRSVSGNNTWSGGLTVTNGRINSDSGATTTVGGSIAVGAGTNVTLYLGGNGNITLNGAITATNTGNNGSLFFWGAANSVLTLAADNTNTFSGLMRVRQGIVSITNANSLTRGVLELNSGGGNTVTLLVNSNTTRAYETKIATETGGGTNSALKTTIEVASGAVFTQSGVLSQSGTTNTAKFGKAGAGTLLLNAATGSYNGQIQIGDGTVVLGHGNSLGTNFSTVARGVDLGLNVNDTSMGNSVSLLASNGVTVGQSIYVSPNTSSAARTIGLAGNGTNSFTNEIYLDGTLTISAGSLASDLVTVSGNIVNNGGVSKTGIGTLTLSGNNTFNGTLTVGEGTLSVGAANNLGAGAVTISNGGALFISAGFTAGRAITMGTGGGTINVSTAGFTNTAGLNGSGALLKTGSGTLALATTAGNYSGTATIGGGTLAANTTLGSATVVVSNTGTLMGSGTLGAVTVKSGGVISPGNSPGNLSVSSLTLEGGGSYLWEMTDATAAAGTGWDVITVNGGTGVITLSANSGNRFTINVTGSSPSNFSAGSNYSWDIINGGSWSSAFDANAFTINTNNFSASGTLGLWSVEDNSGNLRLVYTAAASDYNVTVTSGAADQGAVGASGGTNLFTGGVGLNKLGAGTLIMTNPLNDYTGVTTVKAGTMQINVNAPSNSAGALGAAGTAVIIGDTAAAAAAGFNIGVANVTNSRNLTVVAGTGAADRIIGTTITSGTAVQAGGIDFQTNAVLNAAGGGTMVYGGVLSGAGNLTVSNSGTSIFTNANTYTGTTTILNGSTLVIANNSALGATNGNTVVNSGGTLAFSNNISEDEALAIDGTGVGGNGALRNISGANTNTGTITLSANATISADTNSSLRMGTVDITGANNRSVTFAGAGTNLVTGSISTFGGSLTNRIIKDGSGVLVISNNGTTGTGQVRLGEGTVVIAAGSISTSQDTGVRALDIGLSGDSTGTNTAANAAFLVRSGLTSSNSIYIAPSGGAGSFTRTIGTDSTSGTVTFNNQMYIGDNAALRITSDGTANVVYSGNITNLNTTSASITKIGNGTLTLSASNDWRGSLVAGAGTTILSGGNAVYDTNAVTVSNTGTLSLVSSETIGSLVGAGTVTLGANSLVTGGNDASTVFSGVMTGNAASTNVNLFKTGAGTFTLAGVNTYTGDTIVNGGTLAFSNGSVDNSIIRLGPNGSSGNTTVLLSDSDGGTTVDSTLVVQAGGGTRTLAASNTAGVNTYSGSVFLDGAGVISQLGAGTFTLGGARLDAKDQNLTLTAVTNGNLIISNVVTNEVTTGGSITKTGSGTVTYAGSVANTYTRTNFVNEGTLILAKTGGVNAVAGTVVIANGATLRLGASGQISSTFVTNASGGTFDLNNFNTTAAVAGAGNVTLGSGTLTLNAGAVDTISGVISGSGDLVKIGTGTQILTGQNSFTGTTTISNGFLSLTNATGSVLAGNVVIAGGTLTNASTVANMLATTSTVTMTSGAWQLANRIQTNASLNVSGGLLSRGADRLEITGDASITGGTISNSAAGSDIRILGNLTLGGATFLYTAGTSQGSGQGLQVSSNVTYSSVNTVAANFTNTSTGVGRINLAGGTRVFDIGDSSSLASEVNIGWSIQNGGLIKSGLGTMTLSGANTYSSGTTISNGGIVLNGNGTLGATNGSITVSGGTLNMGALTRTNGAISISSGLITNGTLQGSSFASTDGGTISAILVGTGALSKSGSGTLTLSGANTFSGATTISGGTLLLSGGANRLNTNTGVAITAAGTTLDLGGNSQTLGGLATALTTAGTTIITNGSLALGISNVTLGLATNGSTIDMTGLASFQFNGAEREFRAQTGTNEAATTNTFLLSARSNSITASNVIFGQAAGNVGTTNIAQVRLGTNNTINAGAFTVGLYSGQASLDFQDGVSGGTLVLRGTNGSDAMTSWTIGSQNSGARSGAGFVDLTGGTLDAQVTDVLVGYHWVGANSTENSFLKIGAGTLTASSLTIGRKVNSNTVTFNSFVTQSGGLVDAGTLSLGDGGTNSSTVLKTAYNLNGGTLKVGTVNASSGVYANTSSNSLVINGGNLQNRSGVDAGLGGAADTASGRLYIVLSNNAANSLTVDADRTMTISNTASLVSAGGFSKLGTGTLILNSSNSYAGATTVSNGVLRIANSNALGTTAAGTTIASGSSLELSGGITTAAEALTISGTGVSSGGALRNVSGDNTYAGAVTLGAATRFNSDTGTMTVSGAVGGSGQNLTVGGAGNTVVSGAIGTGAGTLTKDGLGTLTLGAANSFTGDTVVSAGALVVSNATALGSSTVNYNNQGGTLLFASDRTAATFGGLSGAQNLALTNATNGAVTLTIGNNNGNTTYSGDFSGGGSLTKAGTGTVNLTGDASTVSALSPNAGVLVVNPGTGNTFNATRLTMQTGASDSSIVYFNGGTADFNAAGSNVISSIADGAATGSSTMVVDGATVNMNLGSTGRLIIGNKGTGSLIVSNGVLNLSNNGKIYIGGDEQYALNNASGTLTVAGGAVNISGTGVLELGENQTVGGTTTGASGTINLDGGTLTTSRNIARGTNGTANFNFNGGTLVAGTNSTSFMTGLTAANVKSGGAKIDTAGFNITIGQNLSDGGGGGGLTKWGAGTLTLSGSNAYTGATTISNGGALRITKADALGTVAAGTTVESGAELGVSGTITTAAEDLTLNGTGISSGGALRNIANNNTYAGAITLGSASSIASDSGTLTLSGGMSGAGQNLTLSGNANITVSGAIATGSGTLTKEGAGTTILSANNTFTGTTTVSAGVLSMGAASGTTIAGNILINGGTLDYGNTVNNQIADTATVTMSSGAFDVASRTETIASLVMSGGTLSKAGGVLTMSGASTLTGGTVNISTTTAQVTAGNALTLGAVTFNYANASANDDALNLGGGITTTGSGTTVFTNSLAGSGFIDLNNASRDFNIVSGTAMDVYWGVRSTTAASGSLVKSGDGTLTLRAASTFTGGTTLSAGVLQLGSDSALGGATILNGGTIASLDSSARSFANALTIGGDVTFGQASGGTGALTFSSTATNNLGAATRTLTTEVATTINGALGNGSITKAGAGSLILNNASSSFSTLTVNNGAVAFQTNATITGLAGSGSGALNLGGGTLTVNASANSSFGQVISGSGGLTKANTGTLTLSGNNSYAGATTVNGGTLAINGTNTSSAVTINSGGTLAGTGSAGGTTVKSGGLLSPGNSIGTLSVDTLTIEGGSGYTWEVADVTGGVAGTDYDQIKVGGGTGAVAFSATAGSPFTIYLTSYTGFTNWSSSGSYSWNIMDWGTVTGFDASAFAVNTNNFAGAVTGTFTFADSGGFLVMTYTSGTPTYDTNSGTWSAGFVPSLANGNSAIFDGPGGNATNNISTNTLTSIGNLTFSNTAGAYTLSADSGSAGFDAASRLLVGGSIVNDSTNAQTMNMALGFDADRTIDAAAGNMTFGSTISNGVGLTFTGISNNAVSGAISGAGTLTKAGNGTLVLSGANTYTGATTVSNGVVQLGNSSGLGATNSGTTVASGGTLDLNGYNLTGEALSLAGTGVGGNGALINSSSTAATNTGAVTLTGNTTIGTTGNMTLSGAVGGAYSLTKTGSGALTLSVSNAYSGGTVINSGAVFAGNNNAFGTGTITINGGGFGSTGGVKTFANNLVAGGDFFIGGGGSGSIFNGTLDLGGTRAITFTNSATFNGVISNGALTINAATLSQDITFAASNTYTGGTIINGGDVNLTGAGALYSDGALTITPGAGTNAQFHIGAITADSTTVGSLSATNSATAKVILETKTLIAGGNNNSTTFGGVIEGTGGFTKAGTGTMTFIRASTYTGATTISNGEIALSGDGDLTSTTALNLAGATARFDISGKTAAGETNGSLAGVAGSVVNLGGKNLNVGGNNSSTTFAGVISNTGSLTKSGTGTMTLSGANTFSGGSTLSAGVLRAANASALGTGALVASAGTTLEVTNGVNIANNLSVYTVKFLDGGNTLSGTITNNNSVYDVASGTTNTVSGFITGDGGLELIGGGTLNITGATNNYGGATVISNGTLQISTLANAGSVSSIGTNGTVELDGATTSAAVINYTGGSVSTDRTFALGGGTNGGGTLRIDDAGTTVTATGSVTGEGTFVVDGPGTLVLSNTTANQFNPDAIQVNSGATLKLGYDEQFGNGTDLILNGGTLLVGASTLTENLGTLTLSADSTIDFGAYGASGMRKITFTNSNSDTDPSITWVGTLTITNWQGVALTSSDFTEIVFGVGGLSSTQLAQIRFANQDINGGTLIDGGELVPVPEPRVYAAAVALLAVIGWRERKRLLGLLSKGKKPAA